MNKLIITAAAIALLAPVIASAQDRGGRPTDRNYGGTPGQYRGQGGGADQTPVGRNPDDQRQYRGRGDPSAAPAPVQAAPAAPAARQADQHSDRGARGQNDRGGQADRGGQGDRGGQRLDNNRGPNGFNGGQADRRFDNNNRNDHGYNNNDRRFDNRGGYGQRGGQFSYRGRSYDRFRAQPYRWPGGYRGAGSWRANQYLPVSFLLREYFIDNYYDFGFGRPPYGYEWVRVGDDALLVEIRSGRIVDVAPNVFYW